MYEEKGQVTEEGLLKEKANDQPPRSTKDTNYVGANKIIIPRMDLTQNNKRMVYGNNARSHEALLTKFQP